MYILLSHYLPQNYPDKNNVMTDAQGTVHPWTNQHPPQKLIQDQKAYAKKNLPPQFAELVELTEKPFIQAITDVISPQAVFHDGHVVLVGDAVAGFRPHTAASTSQAAFHALKLNEYLRQGQVDWTSYEDEIMHYARNGVEHGKKLGNRSQFQKHRKFE
jgi:2-polyprenyl-6-methoxyphenol hydroxylase-like FAD-dependent oxidoreductase